MKILVVDDDAAIRRVIRRVLRSEFSADVSEAEDGMDVLDRLHVERFDLIILDLHMKVISGVETLETIRRSAQFADLPVVLVTGALDEDIAQQLRPLKPLGAIVKPFTPALLQERLHRFISSLPRDTADVRRDSRLNLQASTRLFVAGPDDEHRKALSNLLGGTCEVVTFNSAAAALRETLARPPDAVFLSGTDALLPPTLFASKVPKGPARKARVFLVDAEAAEFPEPDSPFDAVLPSATDTPAFLTALRPVLTDTAMALVLLNHRSPAVQTMFETVSERIGAAIEAPIITHRAPAPWSLTDERTFEAAIEVRMDEVSWLLKILMTHTCALEYTRRFSSFDIDMASDEVLLESAKSLVTKLGVELSMALMDLGMSPEVRSAYGGSTRRYGSLTRASALRSQVRWLSAATSGTFAAGVLFSTETTTHHHAETAASV